VGPSHAFTPPGLVLAFLELVERLKPILEELGADDMTIHYDVKYRGQCNMEWSSDELRALARIGIPFTVSCWC
jgi:hypothetical protein